MHQGLADFYGGKSLSLYLDTKQSTGAGGGHMPGVPDAPEPGSGPRRGQAVENKISEEPKP